jgi:large-conductance mechanosensitive channel
MITNGAERPRGHEEPRSGAGQQSTHDSTRDGYGPPHPLDGVFKQVREVVEYANLYVETRKDMLRSRVRGLLWKAAAGIVAAVAGLTIVVVSAVFLLSGIAHGLGRLLGDEFWLGELITALTIFLILTIAGWVAIKSMNRKARERTLKKYERRQEQQRQRFGHTATERAQQVQQTHRV